MGEQAEEKLEEKDKALEQAEEKLEEKDKALEQAEEEKEQAQKERAKERAHKEKAWAKINMLERALNRQGVTTRVEKVVVQQLNHKADWIPCNQVSIRRAEGEVCICTVRSHWVPEDVDEFFVEKPVSE